MPASAATERKERGAAAAASSALHTITTIVQTGLFHLAYRRLTSKPLAERLKSRRESGQNMLILIFSDFGRLFQFLDTIW
jgi:hypothetical protein